MKLNCVTITGADNSVSPDELLPLAEKYPFVEWGILLSQSKDGSPRYPNLDWLESLLPLKDKLRFSGHVCGAWTRDLVFDGKFSFLNQRPQLADIFKRFQINFSPYRYRTKVPDFVQALRAAGDRQIIFQTNLNNDDIYDYAVRNGVDAVPLFDRSGGKGKLPRSWPKPYPKLYCGYAGGLGPDNLERELEKIAETVGESTIWIDTESRVRSEDNLQFDLEKTEKFLRIASTWVK